MQARQSSDLSWQLVDQANPGQLADAQALSSRIAAEYGPGARSFDLAWRAGEGSDTAALRIYVLRVAGAAAGLAIFSRASRPLKFTVGEVSIGRANLTRHWHVGEPFVGAPLEPSRAQAACAELLRTTLASLDPGECLFFEGLPVESPMHAALGASGTPAVAATFVRLELTEPFEHQFIRLPDSFAEYVAQLGARSRQSVLYSQRRLLKDMGGEVRCDCFETEASVERFVTDASAVSRKTYQWNLLGLGLKDTPGLRTSLARTARAGWWRSFILYCRQVPVAFMLGNQHGDSYYYDDVGYDPDFAKSSVGSVLQITVLEYLYGRADRPRFFDFSTGYGEHKGRFGNMSRRETNLLVLPASLRNRALVSAFRLNERFSRAAVRGLDKLGLKARLKRLIRRKSSRGAEAE